MLCVKRFEFVLIVLFGLLDLDHGKQFTAPIKRCRMDDEACLAQQGELFFKSFKHGIPELGVPSVDPLDLGTLTIESGEQSASLQFKLVLTNAKLYNLGSATSVKSLKGFTKDPKKNLKLTLVIFAPELEVHAQYDVNGKVLILPIVSKGDVVIKLKKMTGKSRIIAEPQKRDDGKTYLNIIDYKTVSKMEGGHFNMSNLFNDNVELRESTLKVLNDEWEALAADIQPRINEACDRVLKNALQRFWNDIPYDEFFEN
ncbi:circadian clock-controlled protein daywake [Drosophila tropicalis]|uniref:circadian clock-controlled protein daywake n=1 Tax=Drosophila tropicalis TaxID=46794 RepID=UPI0035AB726B